MKFEEFESKMRRFETQHRNVVMPDCYYVVRLDGKSFSKLTKEHFKKPFDDKFSNIMENVASNVMFEMQGIFAFTQSDEISILFTTEHTHLGRVSEKIISISAGLASAMFSIQSSVVAAFDARIVTLPSKRNVIDYFRWRQGDCIRNALHTMLYWTLIQEGKSEGVAHSEILGKTHGGKINMLFQRGIDYFNTVPSEFRTGIGIFTETYEKEGFNPKTNEKVLVNRRRTASTRCLPTNDELDIFLNDIIEKG